MARRYYTAEEAAEALGVSRATLYAYVSRGLIRSETTAGDQRARRYRAEDVDRLRARAAQRRDPAVAAEQALQWGAPVLDSSLTLIEDGRLHYRGHDVLELASTAALEEVAGLLWTDRLSADPFAEPFELPARLDGLLAGFAAMRAVDRMQALLIAAAGEDDGAYDLRRPALVRTGARIVRVIAAAAIHAPPGGDRLARALQGRWVPGDPEAARLLDAALVLCADHELNVSAFTVRCVASAASNPYAAVIAGLSALQGARHGGHSERVEALLREVERPERARRVIAERLRRGERIPGFGHPLYPQGDPRGRLLLERVGEMRPGSEAVALVSAVAEAAEALIDERPNVDLGLVALSRALGLPEGAPLAIFALGRAVGWIGHAIEQYEDGRMIRPRARYVGRQPDR